MPFPDAEPPGRPPRRRAALARRRARAAGGWRPALRGLSAPRLTLAVLGATAVVVVLVAAVAVVISISAGPSLPVQQEGPVVLATPNRFALAYAGSQVTGTVVAITLPASTLTVAPEGQAPVTAAVRRSSRILIDGQPTRLGALVPGDLVVVSFGADRGVLTVRRLNDVVALPPAVPTPCIVGCAPRPTPVPRPTPRRRAHPTATPTGRPSPTATPTPTPAPSATATAAPSPTPTAPPPTPTAPPPSPTPSPLPTPVPSPTPVTTPTPAGTPTSAPPNPLAAARLGP